MDRFASQAKPFGVPLLARVPGVPNPGLRKLILFELVNTCFADLETAYDRILSEKLWAVLLQYGIDGQLLSAIKSLYMHSEVCVRINSATTKPFRVSLGLRQGCSLSPIPFLTYMDRIVKKSKFCGGAKIGDCTVQRLLYADQGCATHGPRATIRPSRPVNVALDDGRTKNFFF